MLLIDSPSNYGANNLSQMLANLDGIRIKFGNEFNAQFAGTTATIGLNDNLLYHLQNGLQQPFAYFANPDSQDALYKRVEDLFKSWTILGQAYGVGEQARNLQDAQPKQPGGLDLKIVVISLVLILLGLLLFAGGIWSFV